MVAGPLMAGARLPPPLHLACRVQALVLSPTRELATQTEKNILAIGDHMAVQVRAVAGSGHCSSWHRGGAAAAAAAGQDATLFSAWVASWQPHSRSGLWGVMGRLAGSMHHCMHRTRLPCPPLILLPARPASAAAW